MSKKPVHLQDVTLRNRAALVLLGVGVALMGLVAYEVAETINVLQETIEHLR